MIQKQGITLKSFCVVFISQLEFILNTMEECQIVGRPFSVGEELCRLDGVRMRMHFIPFWKSFSHNLALLCPLKDGSENVQCSDVSLWYHRSHIPTTYTSHEPYRSYVACLSRLETHKDRFVLLSVVKSGQHLALPSTCFDGFQPKFVDEVKGETGHFASLQFRPLHTELINTVPTHHISYG